MSKAFYNFAEDNEIRSQEPGYRFLNILKAAFVWKPDKVFKKLV